MKTTLKYIGILLVFIIFSILTLNLIPLFNKNFDFLKFLILEKAGENVVEIATTISITDLFTLFAGVVTAFFFYWRLSQQDEHFKQDSQFKNFLEATKMLTDKDATVEAKISALFLLYDVAKEYPENTNRVIQIMNKQLIPLIKFIEGDETKKIRLDSIAQKEKIIEWTYKGNKQERIIANSLFTIKKVILLNSNNNFELSNTIIFDLDKRYDKNIDNLLKKLTKSHAPIKNLIFLHCNFDNVVFENIIFHYCKFINCSLDNAKFTNKSNLWGTVFTNCTLKNTSFGESNVLPNGANSKNTECEGVEFRKCFSLTKEQIDQMKFENIEKSDKRALIIYEKEHNIKISHKHYLVRIQENNFCFKTENEYKEWKAKVNKSND